MTRKITLLLVLILSFSSNAQNYSFQKLNEPYIALQDSISINNGEPWDDFEDELLLPFNFTFNNIVTNTILVNDSYIVFNQEGNVSQIGSPFGNDLVDRSMDEMISSSPLSYKVEGTVGSRIFKIEYNNCGSFSDESLTMFVNFQVWLYETSNIIEFRYGESFVNSTEIFFDGFGPVVAITAIDDIEEIPLAGAIFLAGESANPTLSDMISFLDENPANTTVYRFTPTSLSQDDFQTTSLNFYPNPVQDVLNISIDEINVNYSILDFSGKKVMDGQLIANQNSVHVDQLQNGMYFIVVGQLDPQKFIKN
jgi:hypothetical protein